MMAFTMFVGSEYATACFLFIHGERKCLVDVI